MLQPENTAKQCDMCGTNYTEDSGDSYEPFCSFACWSDYEEARKDEYEEQRYNDEQADRELKRRDPKWVIDINTSRVETP